MNNNQQETKPKKKRQYSKETLIKELEKLELIGLTDIAKLFDWNTSKVATYITRDTLPEKVTEISGRPVWHKPEVLKVASRQKWTIYEENDIWEDKISTEERKRRRKRLEELKRGGLSHKEAGKKVNAEVQAEEEAAKKQKVGA